MSRLESAAQPRSAGTKKLHTPRKREPHASEDQTLSGIANVRWKSSTDQTRFQLPCPAPCPIPQQQHVDDQPADQVGRD